MSQLDFIKANDILIRELCKDPNYVIQSDGLIFSYIKQNGHLGTELRSIPGHLAHDGYRRISYKRKVLMVHRIMFQKFVGELDHTKQVNHKDGRRTNNLPSNLELLNQSENMHHAFKVLKRSASVSEKRLNMEIAMQIREAYKHTRNYKKLSVEFGVGRTTISDVVNNRTWKAGAA